MNVRRNSLVQCRRWLAAAACGVSLGWVAQARETTATLGPVKAEYQSFQNESVERRLCRTLDKVYHFYRDATGREPAPAKLYEGRLAIAEVEKTYGAGCGY